jgi:hypothetical protein
MVHFREGVDSTHAASKAGKKYPLFFIPPLSKPPDFFLYEAIIVGRITTLLTLISCFTDANQVYLTFEQFLGALALCFLKEDFIK